MGIPALSAVAGSLLTKLEGLHSSKASKIANTPSTQTTNAPDASTVSNPGLLFSQLQGLSQQNPTEFKKITAQVAQQLQAASAASAGSTSAASPQNSVLNQMASNFQHASQTGSFSDLFTHSPQNTQPATTTLASGQSAQHYADSAAASDASTTVHSIFSQALSQIKVDLGPAASLKL